MEMDENSNHSDTTESEHVVNINDENEMEEIKNNQEEEYTYVSWEGGYLEKLMEKWADDASKRVKLHSQEERRYRCLHYSLTIPIVLIAIIGGTLNIGMNTIFSSSTINYVQLALGGTSIFAGLLETVKDIFKYERLCEAHRASASQWGRFHRNVHTVLALDKSCRRNVSEFFRSAKSEMDRLVDNSPELPDLDKTEGDKK